MKTIIFNSMILMLTLFSSTVKGQQLSTTSNKHHYVVLTKKVEQLKPIILTAQALKVEDGADFGDFQIIICGKNVSDLTDSVKMEKFIAMAQESGVTLVACGFSLRKFKVDTTKIPKSIITVENGILYNLQLQKQGYMSLGL